MVVVTVSASSGALLTDYFRRDMEQRPEGELAYRYLLGDGAVPVLLGRGSEELGLLGREVTSELFAATCKGIGPAEERLRQNAGDDRDAAWDITLNFSKSVSLAGLLGGNDSQARIQKAAKATLEELAHFVESNVAQTRRGKNGQIIEGVAGLVMVGFWHIESRYGDPHLHCHLVVFNTCLRHDGTWGALRSEPFYQSKIALGALASAEMSSRLRAEGLHLRPTRDGFELKGISDSVSRAFSTGRERILRFAEERGYTSAKALEAINRRLRPAKIVHDRAAQMADWRATAALLGCEPQRIDSLFRGRQRRHLDRIRGNARRAARGAVGWLAEHHSTFTRTDVLRLAAHACRNGHASLSAIVQATDLTLRTHPSILWLGERQGLRVYASHQNLSVERKTLRAAKEMSTDRSHMLRTRSVLDAAKSLCLDDEQVGALRELARTPGAVKVLRGGAGTGKTRLLAALATAAQSEGKRVIGLAPTGVAREGLRVGARLENAFTMAKFSHLTSRRVGAEVRHGLRMLWRVARRRGRWRLPKLKLKKGDHVILDEAAMVSFRDLASLMRKTRRAGAKLILCGDDKQLGPVESVASLFSELAREVGASELTTNWRQRGNPWMERLSRHLAARESDEAIRLLLDNKRLHVAVGDENPLLACVDGYVRIDAAARRSAVVIGATRSQVALLNQTIQEARQERGEIGGMSARHWSTSASEGLPEESKFFVGDRVVLRRNHPGVLLRNDRWIGGSKHFGVVNGDFGEVVAVHGRRLRIRLDRTGPNSDALVADIDLAKYQDVELGYAATAYRVQGKTVDRALVLADPGSIDSQLAYVALTRQSKDLHVFAHEVALGQELAELSRALSRSRRVEAVVTEQRRLEEEQQVNGHAREMTY